MLTAGIAFTGGMARAQAAGPVSQAQGTFLSGSALGAALENLVSVAPAASANNGGATQTAANPLDVTALNAVNVNISPGINLLGNNGILALGAVNQFSQANPDGSSRAASGAVSDSGAIGVGNANTFPADATLDLSGLLGGLVAGTLADATLNVGAVAATATEAVDGTQSGTYQIAGLNLRLTRPLVAGVYSGVRGTLVGLQPTVNAVPGLIRALPAVGALAVVTNLPNLAALVDASLGTVTSTDGSIAANLRTGAVTIDVAQVLTTAGLDLNNLPANTELLPYITAALTTQLLPAISAALTDLVTSITAAVADITVTVLGVPVAASVLAPVLDPLLATLLAPVNTAVAGLGATVVTPLATALSTLLSLRANVQTQVGGVGTERALRIGVLPQAATPAAVINLASASVGPNAGPLPVPTAASLSPTTGPTAGGQNVTVTGSGFVAGATTVTIGGVTIPAANVRVDSATSLTFATPPHAAGPVGVTVTTLGGTSAPALNYTYVAPVAPTTTSLTPTTGPTAGGQDVTVAGTGFVAGATSVTIGGTAVPAANVTVNSATSLTFTTPAHAAGAVGVTVTTAAGTSAPALNYTYVAPTVPTAASLNPTSGPTAGGQTVTVTGTGFVAGSTAVTIDGANVLATVTSPTTLTFTTPAHPAGPVGVTVTTGGGTSTPPLTYTYLAPPAPTATGLNPTSGPTAGGQTVTVTGSGFLPGTTFVTLDGGTIAATVTSPTTLTFTTPPHAAGPVGVTVSTGNGTSTPPLTYTFVAPPAPTATDLAPANGPTTGGQTVTVTGNGFVTGLTLVNVDGVSVLATVTSPTTLTYSTPAHPAGPVDVTVTTPNGTTVPPLTYTYDPPVVVPVVPTATALNPTAGPTAGGQTVTVTGSGFVDGATTVTVGGQVIPAAGVTVTSDTSLTFVTPPGAAGPVDVTVTTPGGASVPPLTYTYQAPVVIPVDPTADSLNPTAGPITGGQTVTVTGTGFVDGGTSVTIDGTTVPGTVTSTTTVTFVTPPHGPGPVDVSVSTGGGTSTPPLTYTYVAPVPTASALDPNTGPSVGGQTVTVTGTGFEPGLTAVVLDGIVLPAAVDSDTSLTFVTPAHPAGPVGVVVLTPGGTSQPALTYTFTPPVPTTTSLDPVAGPVAGGQTVTVTGTGFVPGATTVTIGGTVIPPANVTVTTPTTLTFVTASGAAGPVDVTVTTAGGTSVPPLTYTYQAPVVVPDLPTATLLDPDTGPTLGGQAVTITGSGFVADETSVTIGGISVPATVTADTTLTFVTPAHAAGPVDVTVTTAGGTSAPALTYTFVPPVVVPGAPTVSGLDPDNGPVTGGQLVTITGTGFTDGLAFVTIGGIGQFANVESDTTLTITTPAHAAGPVDVTVQTSGGTSAPALTYTYNPVVVPPVPTTTGLDPASGPTAGGQTVTVTGTNFVLGLTLVNIGGNTVPAAVTSPTSLTFSTPAHVAGPVDVTVTTLFGTSDPALTYTYPAPVVIADPPTATGLDPVSGPVTGGQDVTLTGTGFVPGLTAVTIGGITVLPTVDSPTSLTFTTPAHPLGAVDVTVTTQTGTSDPLTYTYLPAVILPLAPTVTGLDPDTGPTAGGQTVTVTGTGFLIGATSITIGGNTVAAGNVTVTSPTSLTFVTPAHPAGPVDVTATTLFGPSDQPQTYTYQAPVILPVPPTATGLDPDNGPNLGGQTVTVTGTGFVGGQTSVSIGGITVQATVDSPTSLTFVTPAHPAGDVDVTVTTGGGASGALTYTYNPAVIVPDPPTATGLDPVTGPTSGGQLVTVTGTNLVLGLTTVTIGDIEVPATVTSLTTATFVTPPHAAGPVDVFVNTLFGTSDPALTYTYVPPIVIPVQPTVTALNPDNGPTTGGQTVTVTGTGFVEGATSVSIDGITVLTTVDSPTSLTFVTPAHPAGEVDVTVTTGGGTSAALPYTYNPAVVVPVLPTASGLTPGTGPVAGGQRVTVTGSGFVLGVTSVTIGGITVPATVTSATTLTFLTPAHPAGPVSVTVTTPAGTSTPALSYTYVPAVVITGAPTATGLSPVRGPVAGGQTVTVTGTGFVAGATTVTIGGHTVNATVISSTSLVFVTPAHPAGPVGVTVTTLGGTSTPALTYTYVTGTVVVPDPPVIVTPVDGGTTTDPTPPVTGTGDPGTIVVVYEGGTPICQAPVTAAGGWACTPVVPFGPGTHMITARTVDSSGHRSAASTVRTFTVAEETSSVGVAQPIDNGGSGSDSSGPLAYTGGESLQIGLIALLMIGLGLLVMTASRRRQLRR